MAEQDQEDKAAHLTQRTDLAQAGHRRWMGILLVTPQGEQLPRGTLPMKALADFVLFLMVAITLLIVWPFTHDNRDGDDE